MTDNTRQNDYVNNDDFVKALIEYREVSQYAEQQGLEKPRVPNYIGECFWKIAENFSHRPNFINYPFREDMVADGVENCLMYFHNFDENKTRNAFAYFTQIVYYAFLRRIEKEKKELYIKCKIAERTSILSEEEIEELEEIGNHTRQFELYDNLSEFIGNFEENLAKKKIIKPKGLDNFIDV